VLFNKTFTGVEYNFIDTLVVGNEESGGILTLGKWWYPNFR